jgi:hypothetical protein
VVDTCEHDNKPSGYIKGGEFLGYKRVKNSVLWN